MVDQLRFLRSEVTRVAPNWAREGMLGGQALVPGVPVHGRISPTR
jgi:hypothetical protein